jgi:hypothetical protein
MPNRSRKARPSAPSRHGVPRISTSPLSGGVRPSRISMVVVLPAPLGPSRPKHSPRRRSIGESGDGHNVSRTLVSAADSGSLRFLLLFFFFLLASRFVRHLRACRAVSAMAVHAVQQRAEFLIDPGPGAPRDREAFLPYPAASRDSR